MYRGFFPVRENEKGTLPSNCSNVQLVAENQWPNKSPVYYSIPPYTTVESFITALDLQVD